MSAVSLTINEFMWGFQHHFRNAVRRDVEDVLAAIGIPVDVTVLLVGFARGTSAEHPICVEPETGPLTSDELQSVHDDAQALFVADPESEMLHSDRRLHELRQRGLLDHHQATALSTVIDRSGHYPGRKFFTSSGTRLGHYHVHTCIGVPQPTMDAVPQFDEVVVDRFYLGRSFPHVLIDECLRRADAALYQPDPGSDLFVLGDRRELVRAAATWFVDRCCFRVAGMPADLTRHLEAISAQHYERSGARGRLVLSGAETALARCTTVFNPPVRLSDHRSVRKLLETTSSSRALLGDYEFIHGLGIPSDDDNSIELLITDHATWELRHADRRMVRMSYGKPTMPSTPLARELLDDTIARVVEGAELDQLWALVSAVIQVDHGTTLVISADPARESGRLGGQAIVIEPRHLSDVEIAAMTCIDGAILVGPDARCHAFGVILDGIASGDGSRARGSRYNSAVRYQRSHPLPAVIIVKSDDGTIDLFPELRPKADRAQVESIVEQFEQACENAESAARDTFGDAFKSVERNAFFLSESQCDRVNSALAAELDRRLALGQPIVRRPPFRPNPEMNESYWL